MRRLLKLLACLLLMTVACTLPATALTMDVSGSTAGSAVVVTCDEEAFVIFQENNGTPIYAQGSTVRYIPHTTGTLTITATAGGETDTRSVAITTGGGSGGGDGDDDDSTTWTAVTLGSGTFNVTAESGKPYTVDRRTALGALDASGASYVISDSWYAAYGTLYLSSVNGRAGQGTSGWMYQVNGVSPAVGANAYHVSNGDKVVFYYSDSMSATPETSTDPIYLRVVFGSGSSDGGDSGTESSSTGASLRPATGPAIPISLPAGVSITTVGGRSRITVNTTKITENNGVQVIVKGDRIIIERPGLLMTVLTGDITETNGVASGFIKSVTAEMEPVTGTIEGVGNVTGKISLSLRGVPADAEVNVTYAPSLTQAAQSALALIAADEDEGIDAVACVMYVNKTGIANGEDILDATIRISVPSAWVTGHGGAGALRIAHIADDGTVTFLETKQAGTDENGNLIFTAESPDGLSAFALLALGEATVSATETTAPAGTEAPPETTTPQQTPLGTLPVIFGILIGIAAYVLRKTEA